MKKVVVSDTNIFIDLYDVGLLREFFLLPWEIHTTDFVMQELIRDGQNDAVSAYESDGSLHIAKFESFEVREILNLYLSSRTKLSLADCSVWYYAKQNNLTLLTGDRKLRNSAIDDGVEVRGIIYVFDELVACGLLSERLAAQKLTILKSINPRLPDTEINLRLSLWTE